MLFFISLFIAILGFGVFASYCRHSPNFVMWLKGILGLTVLIILLAFGHAAKPDTLPPTSAYYYADKYGKTVGPFPTWWEASKGCLSQFVDILHPPLSWKASDDPCAPWSVQAAVAQPAPAQAERTDIYQQSLQILSGEHLTPLN